MTLESCLEDLKELGIGFERNGTLIKLKGVHFLWQVNTFGILDVPYESVKLAFIPTPGFFRRSYCRNNWKEKYFTEAYEEMVEILEKEKFYLFYYTNVKRI